MFLPLMKESKCIICRSKSVELRANLRILNKFNARLLGCNECFHEWFDAPHHWLSESYSSPITCTDTGIVARSLFVHKFISTFLYFVNPSERILDWGSGSGLLVRLLRDDGYHCYGLEPNTPPVLAASYSYKDEHTAIESSPYRLVIAIEVVEHLPNPREFFLKALSISDTLIFSTQLVDNSKNGSDWWYYSTETGQHLSFYTEKSLSILASLNSCTYRRSACKGLHIITRNKNDVRLFLLLSGRKRSYLGFVISKVMAKILNKRRSLLLYDHRVAKDMLNLSDMNTSS